MKAAWNTHTAHTCDCCQYSVTYNEVQARDAACWPLPPAPPHWRSDASAGCGDFKTLAAVTDTLFWEESRTVIRIFWILTPLCRHIKPCGLACHRGLSWAPTVHLIHCWLDRFHWGIYLNPHLSGDDTQIQGSCRFGYANQLQSTLSACLDEVSGCLLLVTTWWSCISGCRMPPLEQSATRRHLSFNTVCF